MDTLTKVAIVLANIGALNWGLAVFNLNLVTLLLGAWPVVVKIVYALVGISGIYCLAKLIMNK
jgi:uncharacterized membrane protein YuzA (DUF378 family)